MELPFFTTNTGGGSSSSNAAATTKAEALRWLAIAEKLLAGRDLVGSKSFAARARESDPTLLYADQIIAVADTLLSGDKRINNHLPDWYSVLQLTPQQSRDTELIAGQYRKLALLLNPQKNKLPFSDQAFTLVVSAWHVLSNPSRKNLYDNELMAQLRVNSVSPEFYPGISREQVNYQQPFEINFQVMSQQAMREQLMQPQPQYGVREPPPSQILPQLSQGQNLTREPVTQQLPLLNREQVRQPQAPAPAPPLQPQPQPKSQQQRKDSFMGNTVTHNFYSNVGNMSNSGDNNDNRNDGGGMGNNRNVNENIGRSGVGEEERGADGLSDDGELSFWTSCPYCYYMYEYPSVYEECTLRCQNCRRAFQGVVIPSPPPIVDGQDGYFCSWGLMPLGVSMGILERNRSHDRKWTPFSPMFTCPRGMGNNAVTGNWNSFGGWNVNNSSSNAGARSGSAGGKKKNSGPRVYVDDEDVFLEYSDTSGESDNDWRTENRKKKSRGEKKTEGVKSKGTGTPGRRGRPPKVDKGKNLEGGGSENVQNIFVAQEAVRVPNVSPLESSKRVAAANARRHSARVAKDFGKLDLNVEFNNEVEEPVRRVSQGNGTGRGEEDIIEGGGFFEGLDEFLSTLPILSVEGDDRVRAAYRN
ncbi:hypothetical protein ACH5RR_002065 [Cinchona calisaya]|uniref:J domain-containing protein n=1 Tax=Cinchona calisaya TaxID=153742 RepID=A0ABD3B6J6_9GENT